MKNTDSQAQQTKVTIVLDRRTQKRDGTFPVKIRVWDGHTQKAKRYGTKLSLTDREFQSAWETVKPRTEFKALRQKLQDIVSDTQKAVDQLEHFTFEAFERKAQTPKGEAVNVFYHYAKRVDELRAAKQYNTASNYNLAAKSLKAYADSERLTFARVTPRFLQGFEDYMTGQGRSLTTVSIYIRTLRTIFNDAIAAKDVTPEQYPFGRRKYVVPASTNPKKALTPQQLKALRDAPAATPEQERARAFFFFSYASNGMNMKDIALLKWEQMEADRFTFTRAKTQRTKKDKQTAITVFLTDFHRDIISQFGNDPKRSTYVFPILSADMDAEAHFRDIRNFTTYVNQHIKKLCTANGLQVVSTYWARHSFATVAVRKGASMEFMRESLGHSDMKTTLNYFAGFDDEAKKELAVSIMDF
jgi:integrase/recombinase XerD